jgi:hypothetical protein
MLDLFIIDTINKDITQFVNHILVSVFKMVFSLKHLAFLSFEFELTLCMLLHQTVEKPNFRN